MDPYAHNVDCTLPETLNKSGLTAPTKNLYAIPARDGETGKYYPEEGKNENVYSYAISVDAIVILDEHQCLY